MPWTGQSFSAHNGHLNPHEAAHAARIANAVLKQSGDDGLAIAVANKHFQHRDDGGPVLPILDRDLLMGPRLQKIINGVQDDDDAATIVRSLQHHGMTVPRSLLSRSEGGGVAISPKRRDEGGGITDPMAGGALAPSPQTMNPMTQGMIQRYASMAPERLRELAVMMGGSPQAQIIQRVLQQKRMAPALADGGMTPNFSPWWTRSQERAETSGAGATGFLHGSTPGRADEILTTAPAGAHVIPSDVISGLGEGNSLAGAKAMEHIIRTGPGGVQMPRGGGGHGFPRPPGVPHQASGGSVVEQTPVALSHGEWVASPEDVLRWGNGDAKLGHRIFDHFIVEMRKLIIKTMKALPGPVRSGRK